MPTSCGEPLGSSQGMARCRNQIRKNSNLVPRGHPHRCRRRLDQVLTGPRRDYDEGMNGPVYYVCQNCIDKDNARIADELADDDLSYDYGDWG